MFIHWQKLISGMNDISRTAAGIHKDLAKTMMAYFNEFSSEERRVFMGLMDAMTEIERAGSNLKDKMINVKRGMESKQPKVKGFKADRWSTHE